MTTSAQQSAREVHRDPAYLAYATALDRLLAEHGVVAEARFVNVDVEHPAHGRAMLRTFVMEAGTGTPVLLLNGTPATAAVWVPLLGSLTGVRAVVVDRPGHGLTGEFDYAVLDDLRAHGVSFLESVLDALGLDQVVVAGNSLGGLWGLWLAVDRPRRVSGIVELGLPPGLLTGTLPPIFGLVCVPWIAALMRRLDPPSAASTRRFFHMMGDPPVALGEALVDAHTQGQRLPNVEGGMGHLIQRFVRFPGRMHPGMVLDAATLAKIRQPTLLLAGRRDFLGGLGAARRMAGAIPGAEVAELGVGHLPWLQDGEGAARAVERFVRDRLAAR